MPEVKILLASDDFNQDYDSYYYQTEVRGSINDWEEISEEDLDWLRKYRHNLPVPFKGFKYIILVKDYLPLVERVNSIASLIEKEKIRIAEEEAKRAETNRRRAETKRKNKEEKERKLLEQLKGKYENG